MTSFKEHKMSRKIKVPRKALLTLAFGIPEVVSVVREGVDEADEPDSPGGEEVTVEEIEGVLTKALVDTGLLRDVAQIIYDAND